MAKITSINHIAFAVKNLNDSLHNATEILGGELMMKFESLEDKYEGACVKFGTSIMSFITSYDPESFIFKYVEKHGNGIQHIGLEIDNIEQYVNELEKKGVKVDTSEMSDKKFPESLVTAGLRTGSFGLSFNAILRAFKGGRGGGIAGRGQPAA